MPTRSLPQRRGRNKGHGEARMWRPLACHPSTIGRGSEFGHCSSEKLTAPEGRRQKSNMCICDPCGSKQPFLVLWSLRQNHYVCLCVRCVCSRTQAVALWRAGIVSHISPTCTFMRCPFTLILIASAFDADISWPVGCRVGRIVTACRHNRIQVACLLSVGAYGVQERVEIRAHLKIADLG